jgi:polysaccharide export outer membrane protein
MPNEGEAMNTATIISCLVLMSAVPAVAQNTPPPANAPAPAVKTSSASVPNDYRLVVGDKLRIEVYRDTQLSQSLQIRPDGKITLPLVGDIVAAGHTPTALRDSIADALKEWVTNPTVTVIVVETEPQTISVLGEVNNPGSQPLKGQVSVLEALATAGGFKDFANTKKIMIKRITPTGVQTIMFNYKDAIKSSSKPMYLQPGDIIIVP